MEVTRNLDGIVPDPVRHWVKVAKEAGAVNNLTIGVPDRMPADMLAAYAKAAYDYEMKGSTGYPPFDGEESLKRAIVSLEGNFGAELTDQDIPSLYVTVGASQALQFVFSLFPSGSELMVATPAWGTIHNMAAHSGVKGFPAALFVNGKFIEENAKKALTKETAAVYVNYPNNPTGETIGEAELRRMCSWAATANLQIITDEPYKYLIFDRKKTPYKSPVSFGGDIAGNVSLVSSFSKIVKPDIRLGFIRLSTRLASSHKMVGYYFRNLSAGASAAAQAGVTAILEKDPSVSFLKPIVEGYKRKSDLIAKYMRQWGCELPYKPAATYMMFPTTPDGSDADEWVTKTAYGKKTAFVPGTSFGGTYKGFEHLRKHFRIGFGGGMTEEKARLIMEDITGRRKECA